MASIPFTGRIDRSKGSWEMALPLLPIACSVFLLSAFTWYRTQGDLGEGLLAGAVVSIHDFLGFEPAFMLCLLVMAWSSIWFFTSRIEEPGSRILKILGLTLCLAILVNLKADGAVSEQGGLLGGWLAGRMTYVFGFTMSSLLVAGAAIVFLLLSTDFFFYSYFENIGRGQVMQKAKFDDEGVEAATVQAFESLAEQAPAVASTAATGSKTGRYSQRGVRRLDVQRRYPSGRPTQVLEEDPLDRVFPGPLVSPELESSPELEPEPELAEAEDFGLAIEAAEVENEEVAEAEEEEVDEAADEEEVAETEDQEVEETAEEQEADEEVEGTADEEEEDEYEEEEDSDADGEHEEDDGFAEGRAEQDLADQRAEAGAEPPSGAVEDAVILPRPRHHSRRQGSLFPGAEGDESLVDEAARLVISHDRASASFLRRRLRISRQEAIEVIHTLKQRGVLECEEGAAQGSVVMDLETWEAR